MTDRFTVRMIVAFIGTVSIIGSVGTIYLIRTATTTVDAATIAVVSGFTGMAIGQLGSMMSNLSSHPRAGEGVTPVVVSPTVSAVPATVVEDNLTHSFVGDDDGLCEECGLSLSEGPHR